MKLTTNLYTSTGTKSKTKPELPASVFNQPGANDLLAQAVRVYLHNQRQNTKKVKNRAEIVASTRKIWRQKGTGRARHGAVSAPIFVGGGQAHGPRGKQNYQRKLSKKMRKKAILAALTHQFQSDTIQLIKDLDKIDPKTKIADQLLQKIINKDYRQTLIILNQPYPNLTRATSNLKQVALTQASRLNIYELLKAQHILIEQSALDTLQSIYTNQ